jgi:hypothetical protein
VRALYGRAAAARQRLEAWVDRRPRLAWSLVLLFVLLAAAVESSHWVRLDYPAATWHANPPGIEVELVFRHAPNAGWNEFIGYWTGRHELLEREGRYYQPLTGSLFLLEYHLFGMNNRLWTLLNVVLHPVCVVTLAWTTSLFVAGSRLRRMTAALLAGLLFGAPGLADRSSQAWIVSWWPVQPDIVSLILSLLMLAAVGLFLRAETQAEERAWAVLAILLFAPAVWFKETAFTAGIGACLLLLRRPKGWPLLGAVAVSGLLLFGWRILALGGRAYYGSENRPDRAFAALLHDLNRAATTLQEALVPLGLLLLGVGLSFLIRREWGPAGRLGMGLLVLLAGGVLLYGPPWDLLFAPSMRPLWELFLAGLLLIGLGLALRHWPWPEFLCVYLLNQFLALCFPRQLAWHGYWPSAFGCMVLAAALQHLGEWTARRLETRYAAPAPAAA